MVLCKPTNYPYRITEGWPVSRIYRFSLDIRNCGGLGVCRRQCSFTGALSSLCCPGCPFTFTCIKAYCIARQAVFNIISEMIMNVVVGSPLSLVGRLSPTALLAVSSSYLNSTSIPSQVREVVLHTCTRSPAVTWLTVYSLANTAASQVRFA